METINRGEYLNRLKKESDSAIKSTDLATKLGGYVLRVGLVEFLLIQVLRLFEKMTIVACGSRDSGTEEDFIYENHRITTRGIVKRVRKISISFADQNLKKMTTELVDLTDSFLDNRNKLLHRICHPIKQIDSFMEEIDKEEPLFQKLIAAQRKIVIFFRDKGCLK